MDCLFCKQARLDRSILAETKLSFAVLDGYPVSDGHTLVIPKRHVATIWELTTEEYVDAFDLIRRVKDVLQDRLKPQGLWCGS
jgi:ATP adenylyltransferase